LVSKQLEVVHGRKTHKQWHESLYLELFRQSSQWNSLPLLDATNQTTVVTFNYDLNIEVAIARHLEADSGIDPASAWEHATDCPIHHVHGLLDMHEVIASMLSDESVRIDVDISVIQRAARLLGLATDDAEQLDADALNMARKAVWEASEIAFIGFGFDLRNLDRIGIGKAHPRWVNGSRSILATTQGMSAKALDAAVEQMGCPIDAVQDPFRLSSVVSSFLAGIDDRTFRANRYPR
jgi:hypothetical protein